MPDETDVPSLLPALLCHRLLDALLDEDTPANVIHRLLQAYRLAALVHRPGPRNAAAPASRPATAGSLANDMHAIMDVLDRARQANMLADGPLPIPDDELDDDVEHD